MQADTPDNPPEDRNGDETPVAVVATQEAISIEVRNIEDERTPEGMACMATFVGERLIARSVVSPEALAGLEGKGVFEEPVQLGLAATVQEPGVQGRLFALVPATDLMIEEEPDEPEEPWEASVPKFEPEQEPDSSAPSEDDFVPLLLGHVVRFSKDRKYPSDLPSEAADILRSVLSDERPLRNVVDRVLEDLLGD